MQANGDGSIKVVVAAEVDLNTEDGKLQETRTSHLACLSIIQTSNPTSKDAICKLDNFAHYFAQIKAESCIYDLLLQLLLQQNTNRNLVFCA